MLDRYAIVKNVSHKTVHKTINHTKPEKIDMAIKHEIRSCAVDSDEYKLITSGDPYLYTSTQTVYGREYRKNYWSCGIKPLYEFYRYNKVYYDAPIKIHRISISGEHCLYEYSKIEGPRKLKCEYREEYGQSKANNNE